MGEVNKSVISQLIKISKLDGNLARVAAERKKLEDEIADKEKALKKADLSYRKRELAYKEKRASYDKEEKRLKQESQNLIDRRKQLTTLNNYKVQQAAEREIEATSKAIGAHEEAMLKVLDELEEEGESVAAEQKQVTEKREELDKLKTEAKETIKELNKRAEGYTREKEELLDHVPDAKLIEYNRVRKKYPTDAMVPLSGETCSGCFMTLGPQFMVKIGRAEELVRCRGCGRILYLEETVEG